MVLAEPGIFWEHSHEHRSVLKEPAGCTSKAGCLKTEGPAPSRRILLRLRDGVTERHFCHHLWTARLATLSEGKPTTLWRRCLQKQARVFRGQTVLMAMEDVCILCSLLTVFVQQCSRSFTPGPGAGASEFTPLCSICRLFLRAGGAVPVLLGNQRVGLATMSRGRWDGD